MEKHTETEFLSPETHMLNAKQDATSPRGPEVTCTELLVSSFRGIIQEFFLNVLFGLWSVLSDMISTEAIYLDLQKQAGNTTGITRNRYYNIL